MTRPLPAQVATTVANNAAGTETLNWLNLVKLELDSGTVYMHSGHGDLSWDGETWIGVGAMGVLSGIPETTSLDRNEITATLSHIPLSSLPDFIDEFTINNPVGRNWVTYLAVLNDDMTIKDVLTLDSGFIGSPEIEEGAETGGIALKLLNESSRLPMSKFYRMTDQGQQAIWPGDRGFEYVTDTNLNEVSWGKTSTTVPSTGGYSGGGKFRRKFRF